MNTITVADKQTRVHPHRAIPSLLRADPIQPTIPHPHHPIPIPLSFHYHGNCLRLSSVTVRKIAPLAGMARIKQTPKPRKNPLHPCVCQICCAADRYVGKLRRLGSKASVMIVLFTTSIGYTHSQYNKPPKPPAQKFTHAGAAAGEGRLYCCA